jgi:hypothetical protein
MSQKITDIDIYVDQSRVLSMGNALAMIISWSMHQHIGRAILHGFFGWAYVLFIG